MRALFSFRLTNVRFPSSKGFVKRRIEYISVFSSKSKVKRRGTLTQTTMCGESWVCVNKSSHFYIYLVRCHRWIIVYNLSVSVVFAEPRSTATTTTTTVTTKTSAVSTISVRQLFVFGFCFACLFIDKCAAHSHFLMIHFCYFFFRFFSSSERYCSSNGAVTSCALNYKRRHFNFLEPFVFVCIYFLLFFFFTRSQIVPQLALAFAYEWKWSQN